jgi:hypothetical protein
MTSCHLQRKIPSKAILSQVSEKEMNAGCASLSFNVRLGKMKKAMTMAMAVKR